MSDEPHAPDHIRLLRTDRDALDVLPAGASDWFCGRSLDIPQFTVVKDYWATEVRRFGERQRGADAWGVCSGSSAPISAATDTTRPPTMNAMMTAASVVEDRFGM